MNPRTPTAALVASCISASFPVFAETHADRTTVYQGTLHFGQITRSGSAINGVGSSNFEIEDVTTYGLAGMASFPVADAFRAQVNLQVEETDFPSTVDGLDANDTYSASQTLALHFGYEPNPYYIGAFVGGGRVSMIEDDEEADLTFYGINGRWAQGDWAMAGQVGLFDTESEDPEGPQDATYFGVTGQRFFNGGKTMVEGSLGFGAGEQDTDATPADEVDYRIINVGAEHLLDFDVMGGSMSIFGEIMQVRVEETNSAEDDDLDDVNISLGVRILFGAPTLKDRTLQTAPKLPQFHRFAGATNAVD